MKALTVWQPWASLIATGAKPYEFRGWEAPKSLIGQRIAIHAGKRPMRVGEVENLIGRLRSFDHRTRTGLHWEIALPFLEKVALDMSIVPLSSIVCTAIVGEPLIGWKVIQKFGARVNDSDRDEHCNWGWPLTDIRPVEPIIPIRGAQGLWTVNDARLGDG